MVQPFESQSPGPLARLLGRVRKAGAIREIEDLLAHASSVRATSAEQVREVAARRGVDLSRELGEERKRLYQRLLERCLVDRRLSAEESADLLHLKRILQLTDADTAVVHDTTSRAVYGHAIEEVLADQRLDPDEERFLQRLRQELEIPPSVAEQLYQEGTQQARERFLRRTVAHDHVLVASRHADLELRGESTTTLEDAVRNALDEAVRAVPELRSFEVTSICGDCEGSRVARWRVALRASLPQRD